MRLPGTCRRYSKKAIAQLTTAATYHGRSNSVFRCAYHANVMKTFEASSRPVAAITAFMSSSLLSAMHFEATQGFHGAAVIAMHDTLPSSGAGAGDVVRPIVDEYRRCGLERKAPLGLGVDAGVRLHDTGEVGRQRAVTDGVQAVLARQMRPVQIADVGEQIDTIALAQTMRELEHLSVELEHVEPVHQRLIG